MQIILKTLLYLGVAVLYISNTFAQNSFETFSPEFELGKSYINFESNKGNQLFTKSAFSKSINLYTELDKDINLKFGFMHIKSGNRTVQINGGEYGTSVWKINSTVLDYVGFKSSYNIYQPNIELQKFIYSSNKLNLIAGLGIGCTYISALQEITSLSHGTLSNDIKRDYTFRYEGTFLTPIVKLQALYAIENNLSLMFGVFAIYMKHVQIPSNHSQKVGIEDKTPEITAKSIYSLMLGLRYYI